MKKISGLSVPIYESLDDKIYSQPLFNDPDELKRAELIVENLAGLTISSAKELLNKVSKALEQLTMVRGRD